MEKDVTNPLIKALNKLPMTQVWKRHSSGSSNNTNKPDVTGSHYGIRLEIEVKRPGKKPRSGQYKELRKFRKLGCIAFWTDDVQDGLDQLAFWYKVINREIEHPGYQDLKPKKPLIIKDLVA